MLVRSEEAAYFAWALSALAPFGSVKQPPQGGKGKAPPPYGTLAAREGIKATNKLSEVCTAAYNHREEILSLKNAVLEGAPDVKERDKFGMAIRHWDARGGHWRLQVLSALLVEAMEVLPSSAGNSGELYQQCTLVQLLTPLLIATVNYEGFLGGWQAFLDHLEELDVMEAPTLKRLIDGTQLAKALGVKPGKWMAQALEICVAWQLRHPEATDPAGAVEEVDSKRKEIGIPTE